jgi:hypothetical protein
VGQRAPCCIGFPANLRRTVGRKDPADGQQAAEDDAVPRSQASSREEHLNGFKSLLRPAANIAPTLLPRPQTAHS